jgi:hypothetical protein
VSEIVSIFNMARRMASRVTIEITVAIPLAIVLGLSAWPAAAQEVVVFGGLDDVIGWLEAENWWGEEERGQAYVDTLKRIIRVNKLDIADDAVFRDEPMSFVVPADDAADAATLQKEIQALRKSGELAKIIARMQLE